MSERGKRIIGWALDGLYGVLFVALVSKVVIGDPQRDFERAVFWATLEARCNAIAYKEVFGGPTQRAEAARELEEIMKRASRHGALR